MSFTNNSRSKTSITTSLGNPAKQLLQNIKERNGEVIRIAITSRTTIELPAHRTEAERNIRIDNYKKLHGSKI